MKSNNTRRNLGIKGRRPDQKTSRKALVEENTKNWQTKSPDQQLAELDRWLGKGVGAARQRARIVAQRSKHDRKGS